MATFVYPTSEELHEIAQDKLPRLVQDDPLLGPGGIFPTRSVDEYLVSWEQWDNYTGLQQVRGLDGQPGRVKAVGAKKWNMEPGVYGEYSEIDEQDLTKQRVIGTWNQPIDLTSIVMRRQDLLLQRRIDRIRYIIWTLLTTGQFAVAQDNGGILHTDVYPIQSVTGSAWSTAESGTPFADFRTLALKARGHSTNFGGKARAFMNKTTANYMLNNTNSSDLAGKRNSFGATLNALQDINKILLDNDLPQVEVYDETYFSDGAATPFDAADLNLFIPDKKIVVVGPRPGGQVVGEYIYTRNANNMDLGPGPYMKVFDNGDRAVPRRLQVHDGHNGGPAIYFPSSVLVMTVT